MPDVEFVVFEPADCRMASWFSGLPNITTRATPIPSHGRWRKLFYSPRFWSSALRQESFKLFEGFHLPLPNSNGARSILTIHDVRRLQSDWGLPGRMAFRHALTTAIKITDTVVTVSEAMRNELLPYCGRTPVCVIPNALDPSFTNTIPSATEQEAFRSKLSLPDSFLLAVGHFERRKNYPRLIEALAHLRDNGRPSHLLIIGNESGEKVALQAKIASSGLTGCVTLASGLSDREVRCAYALCELFVFPSTYEGFGIPILEAMAAGRPMALSDIPVFREITGGRGSFFSPFSSREMSRVIERILSAKKDQESIVNLGYERLKHYDYAIIAAQYKALYGRLLASL